MSGNIDCRGRSGFLTWDQAKKALSRGHFRNRDGRGDIGIFRCRECHHWHIGRGKSRQRIARP